MATTGLTAFFKQVMTNPSIGNNRLVDLFPDFTVNIWRMKIIALFGREHRNAEQIKDAIQGHQTDYIAKRKVMNPVKLVGGVASLALDYGRYAVTTPAALGLGFVSLVLFMATWPVFDVLSSIFKNPLFNKLSSVNEACHATQKNILSYFGFNVENGSFFYNLSWFVSGIFFLPAAILGSVGGLLIGASIGLGPFGIATFIPGVLLCVAATIVTAALFVTYLAAAALVGLAYASIHAVVNWVAQLGQFAIDCVCSPYNTLIRPIRNFLDAPSDYKSAKIVGAGLLALTLSALVIFSVLLSGGLSLPLAAPHFITAIAAFIQPMTHLFATFLTGVGHVLGPVGTVLTQLAMTATTLVLSLNLVERVFTGKLFDAFLAPVRSLKGMYSVVRVEHGYGEPESRAREASPLTKMSHTEMMAYHTLLDDDTLGYSYSIPGSLSAITHGTHPDRETHPHFETQKEESGAEESYREIFANGVHKFFGGETGMSEGKSPMHDPDNSDGSHDSCDF